ncbi:MAG: hypothetical protein UW26_C0042G0004 [Candidatus Collierbacteria bacterium GW2011_GWF1_44_12]|uniref:Uncharacterized protein n=2 Tax=Candidatus Collieribacteriota TaxID=1752725 RepID=A0A0G1GNT1_9BACT|nr:MAG: hypothetical protein UW26_C0042G0004 [Candidatus Collierbacteria bacterium GW2011_GWF1_44_12]
MTETKGNQTFQSEFHRRYVGGEGEVVERPMAVLSTRVIDAKTYQDVLSEYRWYMRDPKAELPEEIVEILKTIGKV